MRGPKRNNRDGRNNYGWAEARLDLEEGVSPAVVAARLGESEADVRETAAQQGWAVVSSR